MLKKICIISIIIFTGTVIYMNNRNNSDYHYNRDLQFTRKGYKGNQMIDKQFVNAGVKKPQNFTTFLKWKSKKNSFAREKKKETWRLNVTSNTSFITSKEDGVLWLGHSSFIIRINGITIATDPCYFSMPGVPRKCGIPLKPHQITGIDYLLITHGHRDHFDAKSYNILHKNNPAMTVLAPLQFKQLLHKKAQSQEAGWYQRYKTRTGITIDLVPAFHWHKRGLTDFNNILWGSFMITAGNRRIFFCGDSSYGPLFKEIAETYKNIDYCFMPIGAYRPAFIMKDSHMTPEESFQAFRDLGGKIFIPMHYGTYDLADEPLEEPEKRIRIIGHENPGVIKILPPGTVIKF